MRPTLMLIALLVAACSAEEPPPPERKQGRAETQAIRNTEAIGYSGDAIADKIDASLNAQEEAERRRREAEQRQSDSISGAAGEAPY